MEQKCVMVARLMTRTSGPSRTYKHEDLAVHSTERLLPPSQWSIGVVVEQGINIPLPRAGVGIEQMLRRSRTTFGNSLK